MHPVGEHFMKIVRLDRIVSGDEQMKMELKFSVFAVFEPEIIEFELLVTGTYDFLHFSPPPDDFRIAGVAGVAMEQQPHRHPFGDVDFGRFQHIMS